MKEKTVHFDTEQCRSPRIRALIPFFVFVVFYLGLSIWANDFYKVPITVAFLVASATALFLDHKQKLKNKVEIYAKGMGDTNIMMMCLIFILAGAFAEVANGMKAVDAAVIIARNLIPVQLMTVGLFLVACFISLAIGTSCGTIAALAPIGISMSGPLMLNPAVLLGAVVGGAMFGDNLSMISDTTIAATRTQDVSMHDKFWANLRPTIPAMIVTIMIYLFSSNTLANIEPPPATTWKHCLLVTPYIAVLICALLGMNVMMVLFFGIVLAGSIGIFTGAFTFWNALILIGNGAKGMSETLIVALLAGGLLKIIRYNGGIGYLMMAIEKQIKSTRGCELGVLLLVSVINLFTANNTVAIVIAGPIAKALSEKYHCSAKRIAGILDSGSCMIQGIIPYGAQILIAIGLANTAKIKVNSFQLISSLYYPLLLGISLICWILFSKQAKDAE